MKKVTKLTLSESISVNAFLDNFGASKLPEMGLSEIRDLVNAGKVIDKQLSAANVKSLLAAFGKDYRRRENGFKQSQSEQRIRVVEEVVLQLAEHLGLDSALINELRSSLSVQRMMF